MNKTEKYHRTNDKNYTTNDKEKNHTTVKDEYETFRKNLPYIIQYHNKTKNYYLLNRNYEYIGYGGIKSMKDLNEDIDENNNNWGWSRIYLFDDEDTPWHDKSYFKKYVNKYNEIINDSLNNLLNRNMDEVFYKKMKCL